MECATCALGRFDVGELDTIGLERGPVEAASLIVGDVASLRVRALHECRLALATGCGYACYAERQRQSGQGDDLLERLHVQRKKMLEEYATIAFTIYAKSASISKASLFERAYVLLEFGQ